MAENKNNQQSMVVSFEMQDNTYVGLFQSLSDGNHILFTND